MEPVTTPKDNTMPVTTPKENTGLPATHKYNLFSILAIIFGFLVYPVGLVLAIMALVQIKKSGEKGKMLAILAIILPPIIYGAMFLIIGALAIFTRPVLVPANLILSFL